MKDLFLIRHGKSSWNDATLSDMDCPLNKRGRRQVEAMARPLLELGALDGALHVSHPCRARQTIEGVVEKIPDRQLIARTRFDPALYTFRDKRLPPALAELAGELEKEKQSAREAILASRLAGVLTTA